MEGWFVLLFLFSNSKRKEDSERQTDEGHLKMQTLFRKQDISVFFHTNWEESKETNNNEKYENIELFYKLRYRRWSSPPLFWALVSNSKTDPDDTRNESQTRRSPVKSPICSPGFWCPRRQNIHKSLVFLKRANPLARLARYSVDLAHGLLAPSRESTTTPCFFSCPSGPFFNFAP